MTKNNISIRNLSPERAVIDIEGTIGVDENMQFSNPGPRVATYEKLSDTLLRISQIEAPEVVVNIRSTGGDVNDALLIYEALKSLSGRVITCCYGYTASAATVIAQAASAGCRRIASGALYLIHNSVCATEGNAAELAASTDLLRKTDERLAALYAERSGASVEGFVALMAENNGAGRWLSPEEAVEAGLADEVIDDKHREEVGQKDAADQAVGQKGLAEAGKEVGNTAELLPDAPETEMAEEGCAAEDCTAVACTAEGCSEAADNAEDAVEVSAEASAETVTAASAEKPAEKPAEQPAQKPVAGWKTLLLQLRNLFAGGGKKELSEDNTAFRTSAPPVDKNILHADNPDPLREMVRSRIAFTRGQNAFRPTATLPVEDPAACEAHRSANRRAYDEDARRICL